MRTGRAGTSPEDVKRVRVLLDDWIQATLDRDSAKYSDLFIRDPEPMVTWPGGEVSHGWQAVHDHALRELYHAKVVVEEVDLDEPHVVRITDDAYLTSFEYLVHARDFWGTMHTAPRRATLTLVATKDGLRIASAHFSGTKK
jgi:hypothetical protein